MSPLWERRFAWCCLSFAGVCLVAWGVSGGLAPSPGPALEAAATDVEVADCTPGQKRQVVLRLHNNSSERIRILSVADC